VRLTLSALLLVGLATPAAAAAQGWWRPEIGIQGGFARFKPTGTAAPDQTDVWDAPGDGTRYTSLFGIIPVTGRLAIEPSLSASQTSLVGDANGLIAFVSTSRVTLVVRGDVALAAGLYAAAGGMLRYLETGATNRTRVGVVAGVGYRVAVGAGLAARIEAEAISVPGADRFIPFNVYALLAGVSKYAGGTTRTASPNASGKRAAGWRPALGVAGGYVQNHSRGSIAGLPVRADQTQLALPGSAATTPPVLYAIVPVRGRVALELGVDAHRAQQLDSATFSAQLAPRFDIALHGGWYTAAGGSLRYVEATGAKGFVLSGATLAAGYRFPLTEQLGGRVELNYTAFKERRDFPLAQNIVAVMFGVTMAAQ
jgi:hypothetical protein